MPRKQLGEEPLRPTSGKLVDRLVDELESSRQTGQPVIYEQHFGDDKISVTVIWDDWCQLPMEDRTAAILEAFIRAEGADYRKNIALASGLTVPEAEEAGMLPFFIIPAHRKEDKVTLEACQQAMIDIGASTLATPNHPRLRFASEKDAEIAKQELINRLPHSDPVWVIAQDIGAANEWLER